MITKIHAQFHGFSELHVTNQSGDVYKYQLSCWQIFLDLFRSLVGAETTTQKLLQLHERIYHKESSPSDVISAIEELRSRVSSKHQIDFHIKLTSENNTAIFFKDLPLIEITISPFECGSLLVNNRENKEEYKAYAIADFSNFIHQEVVSVFNELSSHDLSQQRCGDQLLVNAIHFQQVTMPDLERRITVLNKLCDFPDELVNNNNAHIEIMAATDISVNRSTFIGSNNLSFILSRRENDEVEIFTKLRTFAKDLNFNLAKVFININSSVIESILNNMQIFVSSYYYGDVQARNLALNNINTALKSFDYMKDSDYTSEWLGGELLTQKYFMRNLKNIQDAISQIGHAAPLNEGEKSQARAIALFNDIINTEPLEFT